MFELFKEHQMNIMLVLSALCLMLTFFIYITKDIPLKRKKILMLLELNAMFLLSFDRFAYYYRGQESSIAYVMVRISNFMVFFLTLFIEYNFNTYLIDLYTTEGKMQKAPKRLYAVKYMVFFGVILLIISQFNGFYYTFDATNHYQRGDGFIICYIFPILVLCTQISVIMQNFSALSKYIRTSLALFTLAPLVASIIQIFTYGVSLTNITLVGMAIVLYVFAILNLNDTLEQVRMHELELMKEEQENLLTMFEQTSRALANAIDAKDTYTHGHSARVAKYSGEIARLAGKSENEIHKVYFAALLHDVGKIGISNSIINKNGKLTDEEYAEIKNHPIIGGQILSNISKSPYLELGARYHHERYDGKGYPEGLSGKDIPDIARIIAVADAYDAMTSKRSYREPMPQNLVRSEIENGMGTQFDPKYAQIMLSMIDNDYGYTMREA